MYKANNGEKKGECGLDNLAHLGAAVDEKEEHASGIT